MGPICVIVLNFIKITQAVVDIWQFNGFQNGGRPPSWISNILMARAVKASILHHQAKIGVSGEFDPLNGEQYQQNPEKAHPCISLRRLSHHPSKSGGI